MVIWSMVRLGINPSLNALGAVVMGFSILVLVVANRLGGVKLAGIVLAASPAECRGLGGGAEREDRP